MVNPTDSDGSPGDANASFAALRSETGREDDPHEQRIRSGLCAMMLSRARQSLALGSIDEAADFATDVLSVQPGHAGANEMLGEIIRIAAAQRPLVEPRRVAIDWFSRIVAVISIVLASPLVMTVALGRLLTAGRRRVLVQRVGRSARGPIVRQRVFVTELGGSWGELLRSTGIYRLPSLIDVILYGLSFRAVFTDSQRPLTLVRAVANYCIVVSACVCLTTVAASGWRPVALRYWLSAGHTDWSPLVVLLAFPVAGSLVLLTPLIRAWLRTNAEVTKDRGESDMVAPRVGALVTVLVGLLFLVFTTAINSAR
jgi:hypothetical protein